MFQAWEGLIQSGGGKDSNTKRSEMLLISLRATKILVSRMVVPDETKLFLAAKVYYWLQSSLQVAGRSLVRRLLLTTHFAAFTCVPQTWSCFLATFLTSMYVWNPALDVQSLKTAGMPMLAFNSTILMEVPVGAHGIDTDAFNNNSILFIIIIVCCLQLEPNADRCRFLTVPEEWKIFDSLLKQAEDQTHNTGS